MSFIFSLYCLWEVNKNDVAFEAHFHLWFGTRTHGVKFFLWVRGRQYVISHEVCVSQSCLHWIIQYLSFNDIWIGICMQALQWIEERRQTNVRVLAASLAAEIIFQPTVGSFLPEINTHCPASNDRWLHHLYRSCTVCITSHSFSLTM